MFKDCVTTDKLNKCLELVKCHASEVGIPIKNAFNIDDSDLENTKYMCSVSKDGIIRVNFFTYGNENRMGLAASRAGSDKLGVVLEADYMGFQIFHTNLWVATRVGGGGDVVANNRVVMSDVFSIDVLGIKGILHFIRFESSDFCGLVCVDLQDMTKGLYSPENLEDFKSYFWDKLIQYGYRGLFDELYFSYIVDQYYEVNNLCFERSNYIRLDV